MIEATCPNCGQPGQFADASAGQTLACPHCQHMMTMPALPTPTKRSGLALASFILGLIGLLTVCLGIGVLLAIIGLVLGIIAMARIKKTPQHVRGSGLAVAGTILSGATLVLVPFLALMLGILLPALGAARRTAQQMKNATQIRGVLQGCILYAQGNSNNFPGLDGHGNPIAAEVAQRFEKLLQGRYVTPEHLINPGENDPNIVKWQGGLFTEQNYSYALSSLAVPGERRNTWGANNNFQAVAVSDRNTGSAGQYTSVWSTMNWRGSIGYNDGHVELSATHILPQTNYGGVINANDNIFAAAGPDDAYMVHSGK